MAPLKITGAVVAAATMVMLSYCYLGFFRFSDKLESCSSSKKKTKTKTKKEKLSTRNGLVDAIGNTPLIRINSLSEATGCEVFSRFSLLISIYE